MISIVISSGAYAENVLVLFYKSYIFTRVVCMLCR
jgi:hypothetical protein